MPTKDFTYSVTDAGVQTKTKSFDYFVRDANTGVTKPFNYTVYNQSLSGRKPFNYTVTNQGPTVVAGPNRTLDPGARFTLTPQTRTPGSAAITSEVWKVGAVTIPSTSGTTVTLMAPPVANGTTITYTYTATDANGATASSSLIVTVRPATWRTGGGRPFFKATWP